MKKKSIDKIVNESLAIEAEEAAQAGAIGYMARTLTQATMPHSKTTSNEFKRRNGAFKITMLADSDIGLPYGSIPRLLMSWITTEAVRTKRRELILGKTLSKFMSELDIIPSGGRWGTIVRLKDQMKRLFSASISCSYESSSNWGIQNMVPIERANLWWDPKNPNQTSMWESTLLLGDAFFNEIIESPVPIDMRALKALRRSPMAIDIYCWLTYRMSYMKNITNIPWATLQTQFGADYKDTRQFKRRFIEQLKKVMLVYPDANVKENYDNLILLPGNPHIRKQNKKILTKVENKKKQSPDNSRSSISKDNYFLYRIETAVEIIESHKEKHILLREFDENLKRRNLTSIRAEIIKGNHSFQVKEELYNFVAKSQWHHILTSVKSYEEYCKMIA